MIYNIDLQAVFDNIISFIPNIWDNIPISQLWQWLPSDLQLAIESVLTVTGCLGLIKLLKLLFGQIISLFSWL